MSIEAPGTGSHRVVIVGGGLAGAKTAEALRDEGYTGNITLIGEEPHLPYERPALSKEYLTADKPLGDFTVHDQGWYVDANVDLRLGVTVTEINTVDRKIRVGDDDELTYSSLVLATGSRSAIPPIEGADADGVHYLRTIDDAVRLSEALSKGTRLVVIGGGWIGLEVAAAARLRGVEVMVVESADQPLAGPLGSELGEIFAQLHRAHGVVFHLGVQVEAVVTSGHRASGVRLADGRTLDADVVLIAVGARANIELAGQAGLTMHNGGVHVDSHLRTSATDVYAVGDISTADHPHYGVPVRTEHWANALNQPSVAAVNICGGEAVYERLPYFYTDQYDLGMEFRGRTDGHTEVIYRGDVVGREFLALWLDANGVILAGMNVNIWDTGDQISALIQAETSVDRAALADLEVPLETLLN